MKRLSFAVCMFIVTLLPGTLPALLASDAMAAKGEKAGDCATRYPIVLAHGMGASAEILGILDYWWDIPDGLRERGARVYVTSVNGMDSTVNKAAAFRAQALQILAESGAEKLNVIAHSHGTIYTRYAISNLGLGDRVASHTSIAGPHRGSAIADVVMYGTPDFLLEALGDSLDFIYSWVFGDTDPNSMENGWDITRSYMQEVFNPNTPDVDGLYYQSYAGKAKWGCPSGILQPSWGIMLAKEGANDGLVAVESARWGNFRGVEDGAFYSPGVDHFNLVGQPFGITPGFDQIAFYRDIARDLKARGY